VSFGFSKIDGLVSCKFDHSNFRKVEMAEGTVQVQEKQMEGNTGGKVESDTFLRFLAEKEEMKCQEGRYSKWRSGMK